MRKLVVFVVSVGALLALASAPAFAKPGHGTDDAGVAVVTISGDTLDAPIMWSGDPAWRLLSLTTFHAYGAAAPEPPAALGPSLHASYRFVTGEGRVLTLEQELYPCAEGNAVWSDTASGQDAVRQLRGEPVTPGWQRSASLSATLRESGMPACREIGSSAGTGAASAGGGSSAGVWFGLALVVALVAIGALGSRTAREPVPGRSV